MKRKSNLPLEEPPRWLLIPGGKPPAPLPPAVWIVYRFDAETGETEPVGFPWRDLELAEKFSAILDRFACRRFTHSVQ